MQGKRRKRINKGRSRIGRREKMEKKNRKGEKNGEKAHKKTQTNNIKLQEYLREHGCAAILWLNLVSSHNMPCSLHVQRPGFVADSYVC